jgi:AcrR family transcriptional regulator
MLVNRRGGEERRLPKVSDAHREARRDEILAATLRVLSERGYRRTSMADVIAETGLSAGAIYGHFEGKQELFLAVARSVLARRRDELEAVIRHGPPPSPGDALGVMLRGLVAGVDARVLVQVWGEATTEPEVRAMVNDQVHIIRGAFEDAVRAWCAAHPDRLPEGPDAAVGRLLPVMLGLAQGFLVQHAVFDDVDDEAYLAAAREALPH